MGRVARVVAPGIPHHVTQRGNRKQLTFFCEADYMVYKSLMAASCERHQVEIWAYCLMPNHVHLLALPHSEDGLGKAMGEAHQTFASYVNKRENWTGCLWQGRFYSNPLDEPHLIAATRYIDLNPVRAGLVRQPENYMWSSAKAHVLGTNDVLLHPSAPKMTPAYWQKMLSDGLDEMSLGLLRRHQKSGRPLGSNEFVNDLEMKSGKNLRPLKRGRKPKEISVCDGGAATLF